MPTGIYKHKPMGRYKNRPKYDHCKICKTKKDLRFQSSYKNKLGDINIYYLCQKHYKEKWLRWINKPGSRDKRRMQNLRWLAKKYGYKLIKIK